MLYVCVFVQHFVITDFEMLNKDITIITSSIYSHEEEHNSNTKW